LEAAERQAAIQSEEIDVMSRNTTYTLSRDAVWGATFAPTTFFDGQGMMVKADSGITDLKGLEGLTICVQSGTTTELNLADQMSIAGVGYTPKVFADAAATWDSFRVNAMPSPPIRAVLSATRALLLIRHCTPFLT